MTGSFIVLEGPDASGTTKHSQYLEQRMREEGYDVLLTSEPTDQPIGREIRSLLHANVLPPPDALQLLFTADRAEHVHMCIEPALRSGKVVISDRFVLSTIVYGKALGLPEAWLWDINRLFPVPDLTIITLPPFEVCMKRMTERENPDRFEQRVFQEKIHEGYRSMHGPAMLLIDTSGEKETVADGIWQKVQEHFGPIAREHIAAL